MGTDLEFILASIEQQSKFLEQAFDQSKSGRGSRVIDYFRHRFELLKAEIVKAAAGVDSAEPNPRIARTNHRTLERYLPPLTKLYELVGTYASDVGRDDVPVGVLLLVDELVGDMLGQTGDKLVHLSPERNYSTIPLNGGANFPGTPPIVFNLPMLDPANALWLPLLAHEVGHSAAKQGLAFELDALKKKLGLDQKVLELNKKYPASDVNDEADRESAVISFTEELLCDALATRLTGPSFLLALCSFSVASRASASMTHPPTRLRAQFALEILDACGWTETLTKEIPVVSAWSKQLSAITPTSSIRHQAFLNEAVKILLPAISQVASTRLPTPFAPAPNLSRVMEARTYLREGIPAVDLTGGPAKPWEIVLAGWFGALEGSLDSVASLAACPFETKTNRLLVKSIELAKVVELWGAAK